MGQLKRALKMLKKAKKPLFLAGGGVNIARANGVFTEVVEKTQVPGGYDDHGKRGDPDEPSTLYRKSWNAWCIWSQYGSQ